MEVQILCTKMIKPSAPTPPHHRTQKLTPLDLFYTPKVPVIFYYAESGTEGIEEVQRRKERLEESLSESLTRFYPLAGRYVADGNWIDCNDEGVEYLEAKVKGRLSELLSRRDEMIPHLHQLAGGEFTSSLASIQINMFDCGGLVLGTRLPHILFDGFSAFNFFASWATASRQGLNEAISPYFEVSSILPANDLPIVKSPPPTPGYDNTVTMRFVLHKTKISSLKARVHDPSFQREATRVEAVTALVWRALMGVSRAKHGRLRTSLACHSMNLRPKVVPPLPPLCVGNICTTVVAKFMPDKDNMELPELKDLVGLLIDAFAKSKQTFVAREDVISSIYKIYREKNENTVTGEVDAYEFSSWCRFPLYEADFGWGKPVWVSSTHLPEEVTLLQETEGGDGFEVWVTLEKEDMPRYMLAEDILALTSE